MSDDVDLVGVKMIALLLRDFAEQSVAHALGTSIDAEVQRAWRLFEGGAIHLVGSGEAGCLGLAVTRRPADRFRWKRKHRRLVEMWRAIGTENGTCPENDDRDRRGSFPVPAGCGDARPPDFALQPKIAR